MDIRCDQPGTITAVFGMPRCTGVLVTDAPLGPVRHGVGVGASTPLGQTLMRLQPGDLVRLDADFLCPRDLSECPVAVAHGDLTAMTMPTLLISLRQVSITRTNNGRRI